MKKLLVLIVPLVFLITYTVHNAYANGAGLPAFFKINDKLAISNPLQQFGITASSFLIPQDFAPELYTVNQPISFVIDQKPLEAVIPPDLLEKTTYTWEFGDGTKAEGLQNTHTYKKIGSYILVLTITINDGSGSSTKFIDSFLLNVVPNKNYNKLPTAVITLNGEQLLTAAKAIQDENLKHTITFDASHSQASSDIIQYFWNFGDGETSTQKVVKHTYKKDAYFETVVLRVKDKNGFISDAFVGVRDNSQDPAEKKKQTTHMLITTGLSILAGLIILSAVVLWKRMKKK